MVHHKLKLNDKKSEFIVISSPHNKKEVNSIKIKIGDEILSASSNVPDLDVVIDSVFNMDAYVISVWNLVIFTLEILVLLDYLDSHSASQFFNAFITPWLDYDNSLLFGLSVTLLKLLRKKGVHNTAIRIITLCTKNDHTTPYPKELRWFSIYLHINLKILNTYRILILIFNFKF